MKAEMIELEAVIPNDSQIKSLYQQLGSRTFQISHVVLPSYETHKEFVVKHPYRAWFIIKQKDLVVGTIFCVSRWRGCLGPLDLRKILGPFESVIKNFYYLVKSVPYGCSRFFVLL